LRCSFPGCALLRPGETGIIYIGRIPVPSNRISAGSIVAAKYDVQNP
jgi:hypothetical protein